jgi:hypothetical protein
MPTNGTLNIRGVVEKPAVCESYLDVVAAGLS